MFLLLEKRVIEVVLAFERDFVAVHSQSMSGCGVVSHLREQ